MEISERFWSKVDLSGDCWEWTACQNRDGYGRFKDGEFTWLAHRWSYTQMVGSIPDGHQIDHLCVNPSCVRPAHLEPVLPIENVSRSSGNVSKTHCPQGHEYTLENTYMDKVNRRYCRTCIRQRMARNRKSRSA